MDGIIFDVDGTLWDSTDQVAISWNHAIKEQTSLDRELTGDQLKREFGKPMEVIVQNLFPELSEEEQRVLQGHLFYYENEWIQTAQCIIYEGMSETIQELSKKYPLFIVSNCQEGYIEAFLKNTGLTPYFKDHTCPGDTGKLKADNIRMIMDKHGLHDVVYVGDTQGDAQACKDAGIPMIYAAYGFGKVEEEHQTIHTFPELLEVL